MMRKLMLGVLAVSTCGSVLAAPQSVSGDVNFKVTVPEVLVLYHWDEAHLKFNGFNKEYNTGDNPELTDNLGNGSYTINVNPEIATDEVPQGFDSSNLIDVTLQNSWAVRSLSSGDVRLAVESRQNGDLLLNGTDNESKAVISSPKVKTSNVDGDSEIDIPSKWEATLGDIAFKLDMSGVKKPGTYQTANADKTFKLTLTGN